MPPLHSNNLSNAHLGDLIKQYPLEHVIDAIHIILSEVMLYRNVMNTVFLCFL